MTPSTFSPPVIEIRLGPEAIEPQAFNARAFLESALMSIRNAIDENPFDDVHCDPFYEPHSAGETGATLEFSGIVRATENDTEIEALFYEAFPSMAVRQMKKITAELSIRHPVQAVFVWHRTGWVPAGEVSLYLWAAARHRAAVFGFCSEFISRLKQDVPIWKSASR